MKKTRICDLLGIDSRIVQGAVRTNSMSEIVAAV